MTGQKPTSPVSGPFTPRVFTSRSYGNVFQDIALISKDENSLAKHLPCVIIDANEFSTKKGLSMTSLTKKKSNVSPHPSLRLHSRGRRVAAPAPASPSSPFTGNGSAMRLGRKRVTAFRLSPPLSPTTFKSMRPTTKNTNKNTSHSDDDSDKNNTTPTTPVSSPFKRNNLFWSTPSKKRTTRGHMRSKSAGCSPTRFSLDSPKRKTATHVYTRDAILEFENKPQCAKVPAGMDVAAITLLVETDTHTYPAAPPSSPCNSIPSSPILGPLGVVSIIPLSADAPAFCPSLSISATSSPATSPLLSPLSPSVSSSPRKHPVVVVWKLEDEESKEVDENKLGSRQRQLDFGMTTPEYLNFISVVPESERNAPDSIHPHMPNPTQVCSKRAWDRQVRLWRRLLHAYDPKCEA
eukprot:TRINITY_DN5157_c0_g1_i1.p1 TRINITY_DN5157_c0_g1~~TRINITY_DN5157_c0_g1_i1.p1  ORF type:complete len:454 (+),score=103.33 TRINITY_DN5157_c0_g1_i1:142-1362(+)